MLERRIRALDPWFHNMILDGIETAPGHFPDAVRLLDGRASEDAPRT